MKTLVLFVLLPLMGCGHTLFVVNLGFVTKTAAGIGAAPDAEAFCIALLSPNVKFHGAVFPKLTQEQIDFCKAAIEKKEVHN
jgi:hypothetical protein